MKDSLLLLLQLLLIILIRREKNQNNHHIIDYLNNIIQQKKKKRQQVIQSIIKKELQPTRQQLQQQPQKQQLPLAIRRELQHVLHALSHKRCEQKIQYFNAEYMNKWIQKPLKIIITTKIKLLETSEHTNDINSKNNESLLPSPSSSSLFTETLITPGQIYHFIPQYDYTILTIDLNNNREQPPPTSTSTSNHNGHNNNVFEIRVIDHVLKFENLTDEFHTLMKAYNLLKPRPKTIVFLFDTVSTADGGYKYQLMMVTCYIKVFI